MKKKSNTFSASGKRSPQQSLKSTGQTQPTMVTSPTLLPTPNTMDSLPPRDNTKLREWNNSRDGRKNRVALSNLREAIQDPHYLSSQEASPANHSVTLDKEKERQMTATSGQKCMRSLKTSDQIGSSLRMCVASLLGTTAWYSSARALTWKTKVTRSNRLLFQLSPSVRRTNEKEFGLLLTPSTVDRGERSEAAMKHRIAYRKSIGRKTVPPGSLSEQLATGTTTDLGKQTGEKLRLQPAMTEWMMGFPDGWTELPSAQPNTARNA